MKRVLLAVWTIGLAAVNVHAASWIVWPGQSLQAAITNATAGDNITLKEGNYVEDIVLVKGLDIRGEPGKETTTSVQGTWLIQNAVAPVYLKGFKTGVSRSGSVTVTDCNDVRLDYVVASPASLTVQNSKFYLYRSSFSGNATFSGGNWTLQRSTISGNLDNSNADTKLLASTVSGSVSHTTYARDCTVFQSSIGTKLYVVATNYWIGYNAIRNVEVRDGKGTCEIVGNRIDGQNVELGTEGGGLLIANTAPYVRNNVVQNFDSTYGIRVTSGSPKILNNVIRNMVVNDVPRGRWGIVVEDGSSIAQIIGNIIRNTPSGAINAPSSVLVKYNDREQGVAGGCSSLYEQTGDPSFTGDFQLSAGSPCIDSSDPDAQFNDLDNTRGNMGIWGGHSYDPSGRTTTTPVVIATEAAPLYIKRGQTITLKARGAVAAD